MTSEIEPRSSATSGAPPVPGDIVTVLTGQHERSRALLADLHESVAVVAELTRDMAGPFRELVGLLATHEAAEELVVYPRLRSRLEEGRLAEECLAEEHEVKQLLAKLEKMAPAFFAFPDVLAEFEEKLVAHADHEEQAVFPILEDGL
ncbi:MAG: hemerythrin domain-containing protein, partial [Actinobacteria bacterium]|nr:hemerythrin domain-containing protein [Actinomycetota bacterium]